jgi:hypothetical protein
MRSPLDDRRIQARSAAYAAYYVSEAVRTSAYISGMVDEAVEAATQVRITDDIIEAARSGWKSVDGSWTNNPGPRETARLKAAFEAAGFEVVD